MERLKKLLPQYREPFKRNSKRMDYTFEQLNEQNHYKYHSVHSGRSGVHTTSKDFGG